MKPVVLAKNHCANYLQDGTCNGVDYKRPGLKPFRFLPEGVKCLLACGQRCQYFERVIMPMKDWDWTPPPKNVTETPVINLKAGHAFKEAIDRYMRQHMGLGIRPRRRLCMSCRFEGRVTPVGPKVRFCEDCAKERVTESNHRAQTKWRAKQA